MLLKQGSVPGSSQRSKNLLSPSALLGGCYKENGLQFQDLLALLIYQSPIILHSAYTAGTVCESLTHLRRGWGRRHGSLGLVYEVCSGGLSFSHTCLLWHCSTKYTGILGIGCLIFLEREDIWQLSEYVCWSGRLQLRMLDSFLSASRHFLTITQIVLGPFLFCQQTGAKQKWVSQTVKIYTCMNTHY